ncbi:MAG: RDD family protein [Bacteroidota bacterium]
MNNAPATAEMLYPDLAVSTIEFATKEQRCINFIIDNLVMRFSLAYATGILFTYVVWAISPAFAEMLFDDNSMLAFVVATYMISRVNYAIYYSLSEKYFNGYTLGKLVTGTRAIREDGDELTWKNAIHRSFSRFLPFEFLSGFGNKPWHDSWTKTTVIKAGREL